MAFLLLSAVALALANHAIFNRYEPLNANIPFIILALEPPALLLVFDEPFSFTRLIWAYTLFLFSTSASIVAYRLSPLHPLAQFEGPTLGKISKLWGLWIAWHGHQHLYLKKLHDEYGPCVRTGPNELSINDAAATLQILASGGLEKGRFYSAGRPSSSPPSIVELAGDAHKAKRRVWNRAMAGEALRAYEFLIVKRATQLVARLAEEAQRGSVDLVAWFDFFALDLMGDLAFGEGFEMLQDGKDATCLGERIRIYTATSVLIGHIPWIGRTFHLIPQFRRLVREFSNFALALTIRRVERGGSVVKDLWYYLADEGDFEKVKPTLGDSAGDGIVAIIAASDTTAATLSSLVWFLLSNPECYRRVQREIDAVFGEGGDPLEMIGHEELQFLSACINETLRLHPPVPSNGPRQVDAGSGGRVIAGRFIPGGTTIYTPPYVLQRSPVYFSRPDDFAPERWLPGADFEHHDLSAFVPFSLGPAGCVGQKLARRELLMVGSLLFKSFELRFADGFEGAMWPGGFREFFVATRGPLRVSLTTRQGCA
ncbi:high nitrogen upregulated cytochrome P450 monooxygenase 2 [Mycena belliarum]|uniref:High nitrogen upregulated cytochrome P450 monooxygenase 2 n=1 Tax=Mycena belliarum TaxID=1033014 RepID=A0AAD6TXZ4_9AGAR|nr:high nitrogen upregulated cytochrome P450 monooxygenase 2 [Mycena belliae]